jgi:tetratricopeptide (TPR) repeat protein
MADAEEPNKAGHFPTEPVFQDHGQDGPGITDPRTVKADMGQGLPPVRKQPARSGSASGAAIVTSALLSLIFGAAGAWAYERYLAQLIAERFPAASTTQARDSETPNSLAHMDDRIKSLSEQCNNVSDQYKQLQARLDAVPKPTPVPDLAAIEAKVAQVGQLSQQIEAIDKKLDPLPAQLVESEKKVTELDAKLKGAQVGQLSQQIEAIGKKLDPLRAQLVESEKKATELDAKLDELRNGVSAAHSRAPADRSRDGSPVSSEKGESSIDRALEPGVSQFRRARYREAYDVFQKLAQSHPDDARVWYYAALSYGLSSNDWGQTTQSMVAQGVTRETSGQPQKSVIDSAFAGLTKETGKDWLDFYRRRAQ